MQVDHPSRVEHSAPLNSSCNTGQSGFELQLIRLSTYLSAGLDLGLSVLSTNQPYSRPIKSSPKTHCLNLHYKHVTLLKNSPKIHRLKRHYYLRAAPRQQNHSLPTVDYHYRQLIPLLDHLKALQPSLPYVVRISAFGWHFRLPKYLDARRSYPIFGSCRSHEKSMNTLHIASPRLVDLHKTENGTHYRL